MNSEKEKPRVVSYSQLGLLLLAFVLGVITVLLVVNSQTGTLTTFTTIDLIGFVLSVLLSGVSITLAVTAIAIGKSSEQSVIRLQTDIFDKTTNVLNTISASTGVTEKRIGDISGYLAQEITENKKPKNDEELESFIRQRLRTKQREESAAEKERRIQLRAEENEQESKYQKAYSALLLGIANRNKVKIERLMEGSMSNDSEGVFDAIYKHNDKRIAITTFRNNETLNFLTKYILKSVTELKKGLISKFIIVLFSSEEPDNRVSLIQEYLSLLRKDFSASIQIISPSYDITENTVNSITL